MNLHPKLMMTIDGEPYVSGAGTLVLAANALYGSEVPIPLDARRRAQRLVDVLLSAARAGGFTQSEVLETLLSTDRDSERTADLAIIAVGCIGGLEAFAQALERAGVEPEGQ